MSLLMVNRGRTMLATLFPAFLSTVLSTVRSAARGWCAALTAGGVLVLATACGSSAPSAPAAAAGTVSPALTISASQAAYISCLRAHGAVVPTRPAGKPTAKPTAKPTLKPTAKPSPGASGAHKGGGTVPAAARAACASLRPAGANHKTKTAA
jgi:hypothetical protein